MAPEVIQQSYDERADMWSAGIMMYQLLTGGWVALPAVHAREPGRGWRRGAAPSFAAVPSVPPRPRPGPASSSSQPSSTTHFVPAAGKFPFWDNVRDCTLQQVRALEECGPAGPRQA